MTLVSGTTIMSIEETISNYVQQQFEAFQLADLDHGSEIAASSRIAASIEKNVHIIVLNRAMKNVGLDPKQGSKNDISQIESSVDVSKLLIPFLVKYIDASLTTEIDLNSKYIVRRVFEPNAKTAAVD